MTATDTLPALKPDERALLEAMAAFKAGNVLEEQVRNVARRLLKMAGPLGERADELGAVEDTPDGVIVRPAVGADWYIVCAPEHPDGDGKVGLMLGEALRSGAAGLPVFRPHADRSPTGVSVYEPRAGVAEAEYSTVPAVKDRIAELEGRLDAIPGERELSTSIPQLEAFDDESRAIERELLVLRNRLPLLQHAEARKADIAEDERRHSENAALAALYRGAEAPFARILAASAELQVVRDEAAGAGVRVQAIPGFTILDNLVRWVSGDYAELVALSRSPEVPA